MDDSRAPDHDGPHRFEMSMPDDLLRALLAAYPMEKYPELQTKQDVLRRAAADAVRLEQRETTDETIDQLLSELVRRLAERDLSVDD